MTSDRFTDNLERKWVRRTLVGRGAWSLLTLVVDEEGREGLLKSPLTEVDFPPHASLPEELLAACRNAAREQAEILGEAALPYLPRLQSTAEFGGGRLGLVLPRYATLTERLTEGLTLGEALDIVQRIATALGEAGTVHGSLLPDHILFQAGEGARMTRGPYLSDPVTSGTAAHAVKLTEHAGLRGWLPPEAKARPNSVWDTWALCQLLHVLLATPAHGLSNPADAVPTTLAVAGEGLDKHGIADLKDAASERLAQEQTNPRFRTRVTDRLGALLARGLAPQHEPSPPYRFANVRDLSERIGEIQALLRPRVLDVGRVLVPASAPDGVFQAGGPSQGAAFADVSFNVTVGCTLGISDPDDLVCGLQLVDLDAPDGDRRNIEDAVLSVQVHPSGRLRFGITLPRVVPGRYRARVAFAIKDSGEEPGVTTGSFEVRPPPGYVPPRPEANPKAPLPFQQAPPQVPLATESALAAPPYTAAYTPGRTDPGSGGFPRPVAPPSDEAEDPTPRPRRSSSAPLSAPPPPVLRPVSTESEPEAAPQGTWPPLPSFHPEAGPPTVTEGSLPELGRRPAVIRHAAGSFGGTGAPSASPYTPSNPSRANRSNPPWSNPPADRHSTPTGEGHGELPRVSFDLPGDGEDLPAIAEKRDVSTHRSEPVSMLRPPRRENRFLAAVVDFVRRDSYTAVGAAVAGCLLLVLVSTALLRAC